MDTNQERNVENRQYEILLKYMKDHPRLLSPKLDEFFNKSDKDNHWATLTRLLNSLDPKSELSVEEWKKKWYGWKNSLKLKVRKYGVRGLSQLQRRLYLLIEKSPRANISLTPKETTGNCEVSFRTEEEQDTERFSYCESIYSNAEDSFDEGGEGRRMGENQYLYPKGTQHSELVEHKSKPNDENFLKLAEELRKWRELDEKKMKLLQKMAEEEAKIPPALAQIGNTLQQMVTVHEKIPRALKDIADRFEYE